MSNNLKQLNDQIDVCSVCHTEYVLPFAIPACKHIFCFLCLKGVALQNLAACPICRATIDMSIFDRPQQSGFDLKMTLPDSRNPSNTLQEESAQESVRTQFFWLYQGRNGWWRFDPRVEEDIESANSSGMHVSEVIICGKIYVVDFTKMIQFPKESGLSYQRKVTRVSSEEFDSMDIKGVAGVYVN